MSEQLNSKNIPEDKVGYLKNLQRQIENGYSDGKNLDREFEKCRIVWELTYDEYEQWIEWLYHGKR